jgi:hypothetical protein
MSHRDAVDRILREMNRLERLEQVRFNQMVDEKWTSGIPFPIARATALGQIQLERRRLTLPIGSSHAQGADAPGGNPDGRGG